MSDAPAFGSELDSLIAATGGDVSTVPLPAALPLIGEWQSRLASAGSPELAGVADALAQLSGLLSAGTPNAAAISAALSRLGGMVASVPSADAGGKLTMLANALSKGAAMLGGSVISETSPAFNREHRA